MGWLLPIMASQRYLGAWRTTDFLDQSRRNFEIRNRNVLGILYLDETYLTYRGGQ